MHHSRNDVLEPRWSRWVEHHYPTTQVGFGGPNTENTGAGLADSGDRNHDRHDVTAQASLPGDGS